MSSLYRRKGSPFWYGKFQVGRECHRFSTGVTKKSKAEDILRSKTDEARGNLTVEQITDKLLDAIDILPQPKRDPTRRLVARKLLRSQDQKLAIKDSWKAWLASPRKRNPGPNTQATYSAIWRQLEAWLAANHSELIYLHEVDAATAEAYAAHLWASRVSPRTYNAHLNFLGSLVEVLKVQAGIASNVWRELPKMEGRTESRREFRSDELERVIGKATGSLRIMLLIGVYTGMRLGDVCLLKWEDVHFDAGRIEYTPLKTQRKNKVVTVPLHSVLRAALLLFRSGEATGLIFPKEADVYRRDRQAIAERFRKHFELCGIVTTEPATTEHRRKVVVRVGFHSLRHSFVSLCAAGGVPQVALMDLVGHGSPAMTRLYSHAGEEQKARAIACLPEFLGNGEAGTEEKPSSGKGIA